jgi:chondroitinase B-like protein
MNYTYVDAQSREVLHCGQMKIKILTLASGLVASVLVLSFMLKVPQVRAQTSCNYYASPNGTGNGLSPSTPFQISKFWSVATPGKTLCLLNGTYTDGNSLIQVPPSFAGTASQPITIRALNDGQVLIGGGTARPVDLQGSYGILEGINAHGGDNGTIVFRGQYWIARRVVAWNNVRLTSQGTPNDTTIIGMSGDHNTLEDCGLFGHARIILTVGSGAAYPTYNIVRRCWGRWEERSSSRAPSVGFVVGYGGQSNVIFENNLATRDRKPDSIPVNAESPLHISNTRDSLLVGSIAYTTASSQFDAGGLFTAYAGEEFRGWTLRNTIKDFVAIAPPNYPNFGSLRSFSLYSSPQIAGNNTIINSVGISGQRGSCESQGWNGCTTGIRWGTTIAAAIGAGKSIWTEVPGICKQYVNGQLTNTPLWPWPMNQRIKDALVQSGRAPVDITQTMEELLGPIPQACKTGAPPPAETLAPRNLRRVTGAN